ncbi:MAG: NAD(P)H-dependent oxidoreductase subunit E [Phycisphaerales bacterium]|nr:MAG: NAD(P)H-dependent oxidoreductase subunit E [Phycisphaerales bacterium]
MKPEKQETKVTITVCVGSSCHVKGAREVVDRFNELLNTKGLQGRAELKGSFCMEHCGEGINWKIDDEIISSTSVEEAIETLQKRVFGTSRGNSF